MNPLIATELIRVVVSLVPALLAMVVAWLAAATWSPDVLLGAALAGLLTVLSGMLMVITATAPAVLSLSAAVLGVFLRLGGAGVFAWLLSHRAGNTDLAFLSLAACLAAALLCDLWMWARATRSTSAVMTSVKESARA